MAVSVALEVLSHVALTMEESSIIQLVIVQDTFLDKGVGFF